MTKTYRIVGWMMESHQGLSIEHWKLMLDRLNPTVDYVPFEVSSGAVKIIGLIDQALLQENELAFKQLREEWTQLCLNEPQYLEKSEWSLLGELAYIESIALDQSEKREYEKIQTFKEFGSICGWQLQFEGVSEEVYRAKLWKKNREPFYLPRTYSESGRLFTEIEDVAREMAKDLIEYSKGYFNGRPGKTRTELLYAVRQYQQFATKDEIEALIRLIEID